MNQFQKGFSIGLLVGWLLTSAIAMYGFFRFSQYRAVADSLIDLQQEHIHQLEGSRSPKAVSDLSESKPLKKLQKLD